MKATHQWIESYVHSGLDAAQVAEALTMAGTEVEASEPVGDDVCYTLEVTSNRTDCLSLLGLARELAAATGNVIDAPEAQYSTVAEKAGSAAGVTIEPNAAELCPYYTAQVVRGVKVGPSPDWLRERLEGIGLKPINNIVDITNFVLFETGQPLHAFDLDKLAGRRIVVRRAKPGERFVPIADRKQREYLELGPDTLVIADANSPQAVAGVMGGGDSDVSAGTTDILLESAYFEPTNIRVTSRRLELDSDSSYRFERDVDRAGVLAASRRAIALIHELAGGEVLQGVIEAGAVEITSREVEVTEAEIEQVLGVSVPRDRIEEIFRGLGLELRKASNGAVRVGIPSFRPDLQRPIDLVEEVARLFGLDRIPSPLHLRVATAKPTRRQRVRRVVRRALMGLGFSEALSDTFVAAQGPLADFSAFARPGEAEVRIEARNPVNAELPALRRNLVASLAHALAYNQRRGMPGVRLFEIANVFVPAPDGSSAGEREMVGLLGHDYSDVKGAVEAILKTLHCTDTLIVKTLDAHGFADGRAAQLFLNDKPLGMLGEPDAKTLQALESEAGCAVAELCLETLAKAWVAVPQMAELPRFPAAERDLAVIFKGSVTWAEVQQVTREAGDSTLREVVLFDEYRGKQIGAGKRSLAFRLVFRHDERTLTSDEVKRQVETVVGALGSKLGGELRG